MSRPAGENRASIMNKKLFLLAFALLAGALSHATGKAEAPANKAEAMAEANPAAADEIDYIRPEKLVALWDLIRKNEDNHDPEKRIVHSGLDVVSPTWFSLANGRGDLSSFADRDYVEWAHAAGLKVWALFENNSDNQLTLTALSDKYGRERIIGQLAAYAVDYRLDGINMDFEAMKRETGPYFEQFIAELHEKLKAMGVVLSVDVPLPLSYAMSIYDLRAIAANSDYVVLMAYDQHNDDSESTGPVAAIDWVKQGIEEALQYVPPDRLILGIPFYTRVWVENREGGVISLDSELRGMKEAYEMFDRRARVWGRDRATGQIFAEYDRNEKRYMAWLEDEHSISLKLDAINDYDLAGMSAWRRGLEGDEIWDMIHAYFE